MTTEQQLANLLAYLWCKRRMADAQALDELARQVHGDDWWKPFFDPQTIGPHVGRFLRGAPDAPEKTTAAQEPREPV